MLKVKNGFKEIEKLLKKYHPTDLLSLSSTEYALLADAGLSTESKVLSHNEIGDWLIAEKNLASKHDIVSSFLIGLATNAPQMRCALPALALSTHFIKHPFSPLTSPNNCQTCLLPEQKKLDFLFMHACRWTGCLVGSAPLIQLAALYLESHRKRICYHETSKPLLQSGIEIFKEILDIINASDEKETPKILSKKLKKIKFLILNDEKSRALVDLLGYIGILQPCSHPSHVKQFISGISPRKSHSSDWSYPIDFWTGKDGINKEALEFWFGEFLY